MRNKVFIFYLLFTLTSILFFSRLAFSNEEADGRLEAILRSVSRPRLIYPNDKDIDLSGKKSLRFQWGLATTPLVALDYIEFCLYKGEKIKEKNLVFEKRMMNNEYSIEIDSDLFENGEFYTWGIRQFFLRGKKNNESFALFRVYK